MNNPNPKILIVGAGPTGLTAALTLARQGIKARIIDKRPEPITTSNALAIQPRTLEQWKKMGFVDEALALGHKIQGMRLWTADKPLATLSLGDLPTRYPFILALPQAKTERLLAKHLELSGLHVERNATLESLELLEEEIKATINGRQERYSWVIGCDGANSTAREAAAISFHGENLPQHFIMADININWDKPSDYGSAILTPQGPIAFFPLDSNGFGRLIIDVTGDSRYEDKATPTLKDFEDRLKERIGAKVQLEEPEWTSSFWIQSRIAASYRKGRLFLAGDAAHRHSPFGGQGLNTGVQDAYLLGALLAKAIQTGNESELDKYEKIRHPIGKEIVHRTDIMTRLITTRSRTIQLIRNFIIKHLLKFDAIRKRAAMTITELIYNEPS